MNNGWTGGQYSLFRTVFGGYLFIHFAQLIPWGAETFSNTGVLADASASPLIHAFPNLLALNDSPATIVILLVTATAAAALFALGRFDRISAMWMWYVLACLFGRNPLTANPSLPFVGWILIAHCFLPIAPFGSLAARGRIDPGEGWKLPKKIFLAAWIIMALAYSYSGYTKLISRSWVDGTAMRDVLENPLARDTILRIWMLRLPDFLLAVATWGSLALELLFAPIALARRARPWLWTAMLAMHFGLLSLIDFADLTLGMIMLHLFTFDPGWIRGRMSGTGEAASKPILFYDGHCSLCHGAVRFLLAEDGAGQIRLAPLQSQRFETAVPDAGQRGVLPDSVVLWDGIDDDSGKPVLLVESSAVIRLLQTLGGYWRVLGTFLRLVPRPVRDTAYRLVARFRRRIFGQASDVCPLMPPQHRKRFLFDTT